jgi:hypothetical protein
LTLWAAIVAERLGFTHDEALTMGRAVAGLNAYSKGRALGIFKPTPKEVRAKREAKAEATQVLQVELLHRAVPVVQTSEGLRALSKEQAVAPASVEKYLSGKFKDALGPVSAAMADLANSMDREELTSAAYGLYEQFRPAIPAGEAGRGAAGRSVWRKSGGWRKRNELAAAGTVGKGHDRRNTRGDCALSHRQCCRHWRGATAWGHSEGSNPDGDARARACGGIGGTKPSQIS